ncbi:MAG: DinB family protein [Chloroflexi bacterium HGW-Chloroflexi-10]|nr:MAG: DinB family protein [Chloroflexi bacterium HGW-Chloroflexi-10]
MQFENLYQELVNGAEIIRTLIKGVTQTEARFKPDPETWSILEVVCHLYDEEREDFREHLDAILSRPTDPWKEIDPQAWVTARGYNDRNLAEMLENFLAERKKSLTWLKGMASPDWEFEYTNPFGSMKAGEMFAAWVVHDNLHIRQLVELRQARIVKLAEPFDVGYAGEW